MSPPGEPRGAGPTGRYWDPQDIRVRLNRIAGQVRGLEAMTSEGADCEALLTQVRAVKGALAAVERIVEMCRTAERIDNRLGPLDPEILREALRPSGGAGAGG